jgi:hypothetical protein
MVVTRRHGTVGLLKMFRLQMHWRCSGVQIRQGILKQRFLMLSAMLLLLLLQV